MRAELKSVTRRLIPRESRREIGGAVAWIAAAALTGVAGGQPVEPVRVEKEPLHRLVFGNDEVQVLDVLIPPRATTLFHTHVHDLVGFTIASAPSRNEVQGQAPTDDPADPEGEAWFEPCPKPSTHRVTNLGSKPIHYLVFQLLGTPGSRVLPWHPAPQGKVLFENPRVRVVRMELAPNASAPAHGHETGYGLALVTSGRLEEDGGAVEAQSGAGFLRWHEPSEHHALRNAGQDPVQVLEFEILY